LVFESSRNTKTNILAAAAAVFLTAAPQAHALPSPDRPGAAWSPLPALYGDALLAQAPDPGATAPAPAAASSEPATSSAAAGSGKKALLYSLILPGLGEMSMGEKGRATGFFIAEGLIWANFTYWTVAGNLRQDDYVEQAQINAGVGVSQESDDYWRLVGQFTSSSGEGPGSYEEELRREARDTYPSDPAAQDAFVAERLPTGDCAWSWSTSALQAEYLDTRESSNRAHNHAKYSFAAAILNRVVSVIDVQLLRHRASKADAATGSIRGETRVYADAVEDGGRLVVQRRF
jgi:hypothetical protein